MTKLQGLVWMLVLGMAGLVVVTSCSPRAERRDTAMLGDPLAVGWRFACAITNDPKDRAECQEKIAMAYIARGECDKALTLSERIENWRKGVVLAEVAASLAESGQTNAALDRAAQAEAIGRSIQDWQRDRILTRVAKVKAILGRVEEAGKVGAFYRSNRDYRGEAAAYHALALARGGQVTNALAVLDGLAEEEHLDVSSWRASGYMLLAKAGHLDAAQTSNAFAQAWAASQAVPGNMQFDVQMRLIDEAAPSGSAQAQPWLDALHSNVLNSAAPPHIKAPIAAQLAIRWGAMGQADRLSECEQAAEPLIRQLQGIEQPALFALLGEAWARLGDVKKALTVYEHALELAGPLTNPRPRAIACVDICLSLEKARLSHKLITEGLNRLLAGFGAAHD
jgi:tetratricopeptide (TPR) repeat protein